MSRKVGFTVGPVSQTAETFVNPIQFGAVGDGIHDDTEAMIKACEYAANHKMPIAWHNKTIYLKTASANNCPVIETNADFSGCVFLVDSNNQDNTILKIGHEATEITSQVQERSLSIDTAETVFQEWPNSMIVVQSDLSLGPRAGGSDLTEYYHQQPFLTDDLGTIKPCDIFSPSGILRCWQTSTLVEPITVRFGEIRFDHCSRGATIYIYRANVTICDTVIRPIGTHD